MSITPLFHSDELKQSLSDEEMIRFLDEPDESEAKRAFLNQCAMSEHDLERWNQLCRVMEMGAALLSFEPDPCTRSRVIEAAYEAVREERGMQPRSHSSASTSWLPGWNLAWAALFLGVFWSAYGQFSLSSTATMMEDQFDVELLSLEADLNYFQIDFDIETSIRLDDQS